MRLALRNPLGLTLLVASVILAAALRFLPGLERWWAQAPWLLLWGVLAYLASVIALQRARPAPTAALRELYSIRRFMHAKLNERKAAKGGGLSELTRILSEAIGELDQQVLPALEQLLARERELSDLLARYDRAALPLPEPAVLERLRAAHARQRAAIEECVQQASNAAGTLVAILQERDDALVATQARTWARDLLNLYDALADVLRGEAEDGE